MRRRTLRSFKFPPPVLRPVPQPRAKILFILFFPFHSLDAFLSFISVTRQQFSLAYFVDLPRNHSESLPTSIRGVTDRFVWDTPQDTLVVLAVPRGDIRTKHVVHATSHLEPKILLDISQFSKLSSTFDEQRYTNTTLGW
ncbi:uncharacterized protein ARMOST_08702 [Armillaria ostoyae]|uniref:Uncharacterized protein n=1 Tax=Armillaria ostoyae TaxID=47428 RepID=A0A284R9D2_ARMOS|nr:uncharacterized protein ARMOST_08702 [Armillaria ostoyae]